MRCCSDIDIDPNFDRYLSASPIVNGLDSCANYPWSYPHLYSCWSLDQGRTKSSYPVSSLYWLAGDIREPTHFSQSEISFKKFC